MKTTKLEAGITALDISKARIASGKSFSIISFRPHERGGILKFMGTLPASLPAARRAA